MSGAPWDVNAVLKPQRLLRLARLAIETRNQAFAEANFALGDTSWGIGCKAHERYAHAVAALAEREPGWLTVHREGLAFTSIVEGVAIRAYRGPSDKPHARHLYAAHLELGRAQSRQLALPFVTMASGTSVSREGVAEDGVLTAGGLGSDSQSEGAMALAEPWAWLMAVETDDAGRALRVVFFQANDLGERRNAWVAPIRSAPTEPAPSQSPEGAFAGARAVARRGGGDSRRPRRGVTVEA